MFWILARLRRNPLPCFWTSEPICSREAVPLRMLFSILAPPPAPLVLSALAVKDLRGDKANPLTHFNEAVDCHILVSQLPQRKLSKSDQGTPHFRLLATVLFFIRSSKPRGRSQQTSALLSIYLYNFAFLIIFLAYGFNSGPSTWSWYSNLEGCSLVFWGLSESWPYTHMSPLKERTSTISSADALAAGHPNSPSSWLWTRQTRWS